MVTVFLGWMIRQQHVLPSDAPEMCAGDVLDKCLTLNGHQIGPSSSMPSEMLLVGWGHVCEPLFFFFMFQTGACLLMISCLMLSRCAKGLFEWVMRRHPCLKDSPK